MDEKLRAAAGRRLNWSLHQQTLVGLNALGSCIKSIHFMLISPIRPRDTLWPRGGDLKSLRRIVVLLGCFFQPGVPLLISI
ncbi:hypothetical protein NPIL_65491 [Nephila pilipes]|uniref:Uncharacterized protein n=1 Tax=Nephila pilipes TaxID=299642 RepID=A0A8X6TMU9_NEPPI|nr:hypothetical protein NPIL_65491 [Nephila pilipes]